MASIQPVENEAEVIDDAITPKNENTSTQITNTESLSVKVEEPSPASDALKETQTIQSQGETFLTCYKPVPKSIRFLFWFLLLVCLAPVTYAIVTIATFAILPLMLVALVLLRLLQFVIRYQVFVKHFEIKILLRYWIFVIAMLVLIEVGLFYPMAKYVPEVKLVTIIGLPLTKWIKIICILIGIYVINQVVWASIIAVMIMLTGCNDDSLAHVLEGASEICGCLLFLWAEVVVMDSVPTFKQSTIFGVYTRKWIKVSLFVLMGYNVISLLTHIIILSLPRVFADDFMIGEKLSGFLSFICCDDMGKGAFKKKYVVYVVIGIKRSIIFILSMVMLMVTWLTYFDDHLNSYKNKRILRFGTWTLISLLVCSFCWLIKSCILLYWEAQAVYSRLHSKTTDIGMQLYFLVLLGYDHYQRISEPLTTDSDDSSCCVSSKTPPKQKALWVLVEASSDGDGEVYLPFDRKIVRQKLINHIGPKASIYDMQQASEQILSAQYALSKESISGYLAHLQSDNSEENDKDITEELEKVVLGESYSDDDWKMLLELLPSAHPTGQIYFQEVKTWMERAHSRCRFLANTLLSEKEVANCLNQVMSGLIIAVTFIVWLLMSGLAKTNILVLIASPLLAATFIFGDTCKSLFQGLIFVYVVHPFDVGDLCDIDNQLLEVKRIGVWCTTFSKVRTIGRQQEVIYPNSALATKNVINHKTEFDWNDQISFCLKSLDKETTSNLKLEIENYLDKEKNRFTPQFHSVGYIESEDKAKIIVHIKHNIKSEGWTYFECLKEKEKRRFECAIHIQDLINQQGPKTETTESPVNDGEEAEIDG